MDAVWKGKQQVRFVIKGKIVTAQRIKIAESQNGAPFAAVSNQRRRFRIKTGAQLGMFLAASKDPN